MVLRGVEERPIRMCTCGVDDFLLLCIVSPCCVISRFAQTSMFNHSVVFALRCPALLRPHVVPTLSSTCCFPPRFYLVPGRVLMPFARVYSTSVAILSLPAVRTLDAPSLIFLPCQLVVLLRPTPVVWLLSFAVPVT
ncbi:hypothetical protein R1flu_021716 [Riccia fluitans]|uniref:Uncharacterized protein n=1 Tax=Riccia fluitans TaxID=41844 RepID=A0ABD1ZQ73_9MARC